MVSIIHIVPSIRALKLMGWSSISKVSKIVSLQCLYNILLKKIEMKFDFSHADKHQRFHQSDTITIDGHDQAFRKCSK